MNMPKIKTKKPENNITQETKGKEPSKERVSYLGDLGDLLSGAKPLKEDGSRAQMSAKRGQDKAKKIAEKTSAKKEEIEIREETEAGTEITKAGEIETEGEETSERVDIPNETPGDPPCYVPQSDGPFPGEIVPPAPSDNGNTSARESVSVSVETRAPVPILSGAAPPPHVQKELDKRKSLPVLGCSSCTIAQSCPEYAEGYVCAFNDAFFSMPSRDVDSVLANMASIVNDNMGRYQRAKFIEQQANGGALDMNVTRQSQVVMSQFELLLALHRESTRVTVQVEGPKVATERGPGLLATLLSRKMATPTPAAPTSLPESSPQSLNLNVSETVNNGEAKPSDPLGNPLPKLSEKTLAELKALGESPPDEPVPPPPGGQAGPPLGG